MVGNMETAESEVLHVLHLSFWMVIFIWWGFGMSSCQNRCGWSICQNMQNRLSIACGSNVLLASKALREAGPLLQHHSNRKELPWLNLWGRSGAYNMWPFPVDLPVTKDEYTINTYSVWLCSSPSSCWFYDSQEMLELQCAWLVKSHFHLALSVFSLMILQCGAPVR